MLVEKYRPQTLDDIVGHEGTIAKLKAYIKAGEMPHLLFIGNSGVGKTAMAVALARDFGVYPNAFLELNASDDRGIKVVRTTIRNFSRRKSLTNEPFKICLLDEGDELTRTAQQALRRTMEKHSGTVRFIITANSLSNLKEPILSRCQKHYIRDLSMENILTIIRRVERKEGIELDDSINMTIAKVSNGDARIALNILEGISTLVLPSPKDVYLMSGRADEESVYRMIDSALNGNIDALNSVGRLLSEGANPSQIIKTMYYTAFRGSGKNMTKERRLKVLRALDVIPNDEYRLTAVIATLIDSAS